MESDLTTPAIEGHHSSYLMGLRTGDLERSRRAVTNVGALLRDRARRPPLATRRVQKVRWLAYHRALECLEEIEIQKGEAW